jgi:hypothetical protein
MAKRHQLRASVVLAISALTGAILALIGLHHLLVPESAAHSFGVSGQPSGHELHAIIGLRNLWLGALAIALAALRQWHGLAFWFAIGAVVCLSDAVIAAQATGKLPQVAFHVLVGLFWPLLAALCWRQGMRQR